MEVNDLLVENLARLARLSFDQQERMQVKADLQEMISFVEKLKELDTDGIEPMLHMSGNTNILREDVVQGSISRAEALRNAPDADDTFFAVPKVIKK